MPLSDLPFHLKPPNFIHTLSLAIWDEEECYERSNVNKMDSETGKWSLGHKGFTL